MTPPPNPLSADSLTWIRAAPARDLDMLCDSGDPDVRGAALEERAARAARNAGVTELPPAPAPGVLFDSIRCACGTAPCTCPKPEWDERPPRVLAVFVGKHGHLLDHQGGAVQYDIENVGEREMLAQLGSPPSDGAWVCDCELVPDGPNDWDGRMAYVLDGTWRAVLPGEWERFCEGVETTWGDT